MRKLLLPVLLLVCGYAFGVVPTEIQTKAQIISDQYQSVTGINSTDAQAITNLLVTYFTSLSNGTPISPSQQNQINNIINVSESGSGGPLTATTVLETITSDLSVSDPTYNRVVNTSYNINCLTRGILSTTGTTVPYDVIEFTVTKAGIFDFEVTNFGSNVNDDSYLSLYCNFNPLNAREQLIIANDDGGDDMLSSIEDITLPTGTYYLVMTSFDNGEIGNYTIQFRSDDGNLVLGSNPVPINIWWIAGLFALIAVGILVRKLFF